MSKRLRDAFDPRLRNLRSRHILAGDTGAREEPP